jgi:hypothetical protein
MAASGRVKNGVVVPDEGVHFPEGQEVTLLVSERTEAASHSLLDIAPVSLDSVLRPEASDDDLLGEMLEGRS